MAVSYRSVALLLVTLFVLALTCLWLIAPSEYHQLTDYAKTAMLWTGSKMGLVEPPAARRQLSAGPQQAHFTAMDGTVRVKKNGSNNWVPADYSLPLERGDVVQTGAEGLARVIFADGSSYTVKQDSLIVVDDNSVNAAQQTNVAVQVTNGTVDLTTGSFAQGSRSQVMVAGATANFAPETSALVRNDASGDAHEVMVKRGSGTLVHGNETVPLTEYERVSFSVKKAGINRVKELGPPALLSPANTDVVYVEDSRSTVHLKWQPNAKAASYRVRISRNDYFTGAEVDVKTRTAFCEAKLPPGDYYWMVQSLDASGHGSIDSEHNKFTVLPRHQNSQSLPLDLQPPRQHGHLLEVRGRTLPGAIVTVNGRQIPFISGDGSFAYLTDALPNGPVVLTVTVQDGKGGVRTEQVRAVIE
jgi:hypothetical protein